MTLTAYRANDCWMVRHSGPGSQEIIKLFGTDALPTGWTALASPETVLAGLTKLNPSDAVILAS